MENPPDLIVVLASDEQHPEKKKTPPETTDNSNEFTEQLCLLKQRFHEQIQSIDHQQAELIQQLTVDVNEHLKQILQKSIDDIESLRLVPSFALSNIDFPLASLRLLHQKELCTYSKEYRRLYSTSIM